MKNFVLGFLATVVAMLITSCATTKNTEMKEVVTVGKPYVVRKFILPEQKKGILPFSIRKTKYSRFSEKDLVPAMVVSDYLEAIAATGRVPIRVKEGFLTKGGGQWYLIEWPPEVAYRQFCAGYPTVVAHVYYVVDMKTVR